MSVSKSYRDYLKSEAWKVKRVLCLVREQGICERCSGPATEVNNRTYARIYSEDLDDLEALCADCHGKAHGRWVDGRWVPGWATRCANDNLQGDLFEFIEAVKPKIA